MPHEAVEIHRLFKSLVQSDSDGTNKDSVLDWSSVLDYRYSVVLGEAGTGKSTEFKLKAQSLITEGRFAFFVELVDLATSGLEHSLGAIDLDRLAKWRESESDAVFFLDALDEAKLRNKTLRNAIRNLQHELRLQWTKVRIVLSSRVSDWMDETDGRVLLQVLPEGVGTLLVVQLEPLSKEQVATLATHAGVSDVPRFMESIEEYEAQLFVERPLDIVWLGRYWEQKQRLGSFRELIEENISGKLYESRRTYSNLTSSKAREGVTTLAGIATINNIWSFRLRDDSLNVERSSESIDPWSFLPNWTADEVADLLSRSIFDESTYGRVRLHHRIVQEYLAASWLHDLTHAGMKQSYLEEIFFHEVNGIVTVPLHLQHVAAWLALKNHHFLDLLVERVPSILIGYGDASELREDDRNRILIAFTNQYKQRARRYESFDQQALKRFSTESLTCDINFILSNRDTPDELVTILMQIVEQGALKSCIDSCLSIALDERSSSDVRCDAIRTVASVGDSVQTKAISKLMDTEWANDPDVAGTLVRALYPVYLNASDLIRLITLVVPERQHGLTVLHYAFQQYVPAAGSLNIRLDLLSRVFEFASIRANGDVERTALTYRELLLPCLAKVLVTILNDLPDGSEIPQSVIDAICLLETLGVQSWRIQSEINSLKTAIAHHVQVRRSLFWHRVRQFVTIKARLPRSISDIQDYSSYYSLQESDSTWLALDVKNMQSNLDRLIAFRVLCSMLLTEQSIEAHTIFLQEVARDSEELYRHLLRRLNRPSPPYQPISLQHGVRSDFYRRRRTEREENDNRGLREWFEHHLESIQTGENVRALSVLYSQGNPSHLRPDNISFAELARRYGAPVATAAMCGMRTVWRNYCPAMPHELVPKGTIPWEVLLGTVGLTLDFDDGLQASTLTDSEAQIATRYACYALNEFPEWLAEIAMVHPSAVVTVLHSAIETELTSPDADASGGWDLLGKLVHADSRIREILMPYLTAKLHELAEPPVKSLVSLIETVLSMTSDFDTTFASLASGRCVETISAPYSFSIWWEAWLAQQPVAAVDYLVSTLEEVRQEDAALLMLHVCGRIYDCCDIGAKRELLALQRPEVLHRLIPVVFQYIRPEEDVHHEGVYSPGLRDHAQTVRSMLIRMLIALPDSSVVSCLRALSDEPIVTHIRDWLISQADMRAAADASALRPDIVSRLTDHCKRSGTDLSVNLEVQCSDVASFKILFIALDPIRKIRLALDEEYNMISRTLSDERIRSRCDLRSEWALRQSDLKAVLLQHKPNIVHISGHGGDDGGLLFHSNNNTPAKVSTDALYSIFRLLDPKVRVLVINACHSIVQARKLADVIEFVVGMNSEINDVAAGHFAAAFYCGLAYGQSVSKAFELGRTEMMIHGYHDQSDIPVLLSRDGSSTELTRLFPITTHCYRATGL